MVGFLLVMFGSRFVDDENDSEKVHSFRNNDSRASVPLVQPIRHFCSLAQKMGAQVDLPSSARYVEGSLRFSRYTSMHYIIGWCRVVVAVNSPMRVDARSCMSVFGTSDSKCYRRSRCVMSDVAFCTAPPIGGSSCLLRWQSSGCCLCVLGICRSCHVVINQLPSVSQFVSFHVLTDRAINTTATAPLFSLTMTSYSRPVSVSMVTYFVCHVRNGVAIFARFTEEHLFKRNANAFSLMLSSMSAAVTKGFF